MHRQVEIRIVPALYLAAREFPPALEFAIPSLGGKDLTYNPVTRSIETHREAISHDDNSSGIRSVAPAKAHQLILNTYKTLLTRGQKGCYVYCEDPELKKYIKSLLSKAAF